MTKNCVKTVLKLQEDCADFNDLTVEQLLYACVAAVGVKETSFLLHTTVWKCWCPNEEDAV